MRRHMRVSALVCGSERESENAAHLLVEALVTAALKAIHATRLTLSMYTPSPRPHASVRCPPATDRRERRRARTGPSSSDVIVGAVTVRSLSAHPPGVSPGLPRLLLDLGDDALVLVEVGRVDLR